MTNDQRRSFGIRHSRMRHPTLFVTTVAVVSLMLHLGVRGSEMADSGWHVATPLTTPEGNRHTDPTIRIAINQILQETRVPLLQEKAAPPESQPSTDGWRPARVESRVESHESRARTDVENAAPALNAPLSTLDSPSPPQSTLGGSSPL